MRDRWLVLTAEVPPDDPLRELIAEGLLALGGLSVLDEGPTLTTYLEPPANPGEFVAGVGEFLADWIADEPPHLEWRWQDSEDWESEWRRGLAPRRVTERIVVKPSWTRWSGPEPVVIDIDPQMAFGTGEHATTRGCLRLLDRRPLRDRRVLDVGSGSGILAIAAAMLGAREVLAVEFDPDANLNARENIERNGVGDRITLMESMADPALIASLGSFDVILANILSSVIRPLLPALRQALAPAGALIVSGILQREREEVVAGAGSAGLEPVAEDREEEWWSGMFAPAEERETRG